MVIGLKAPTLLRIRYGSEGDNYDRRRLCSVNELGQRVPPLQLSLKHNARDCVIVRVAKRDECRSYASF
jgi:hypothetical protein